jgi:hypothetical protein
VHISPGKPNNCKIPHSKVLYKSMKIPREKTKRKTVQQQIQNNNYNRYHNLVPHSAVGIVTRLWVGQPRNHDLIPRKGEILISSPKYPHCI